ncbi:MAG: hypothetical protein COA78_19245 [Blastopirellula sp.]|nr:MAG: hypothetical protein COA78_19245 [Blastopirellula sp.]
MVLTINDDKYFENPTEETIREALAELVVDEFAILSRADEHYIQAYYNEAETFTLEYRDGSYEKHYAATPEPETCVEIQEVFVAFLNNPTTWHEGKEWKKVDFDEDFEGDA